VRGYIDLLETNGRIRDLKTAARKPSEISANFRFQVSTYAQLCENASGEGCVDVLVKSKTPQLVQLDPFKVQESDTAQTQAMYPLVQQSIRAGVFLPNRENYMCSRRYCGHWRACDGGSAGRWVNEAPNVGVTPRAFSSSDSGLCSVSLSVNVASATAGVQFVVAARASRSRRRGVHFAPK
jgi:hypothetical protein